MGEPGTPPTVRYQSFVYAPIRNPDGNVVGIFLEGFDVTESKLAKDEVQRLNAELVHVSRASAMSTMAATLAHELNQPLTAALNFITGSLRVLEEGGDENALKVRAALERAQGSVRHAAATIRALRNVVNKRPMSTAPVNLLQIIQSASIVALSGWEQVEIDIVVDAPDSLFVEVDRVQIEQVFINLMRNAAEAMKNSTRPSLKVTASGNGKFADVALQDNGPGLSDEVRARLFQPLDTSKAEGMGLGLSICRTIIEAHGGKIGADNRSAGACFRLSLPIVEEDPV